MRILLVNKFYYPRGGDCICVMNLEKMLLAQGDEVALFAMQHEQNIPTQWEQYFPAEVDFSGGIKAKFVALARALWGRGVKDQFERLLNDFHPDVVHLHNVHSYLSPLVAKLAHAHHIPVVWTLHDYKLICPSYACLRENKPCELCYADKSQVVKRRCMKGSLLASVIAYLETKVWNCKRLEKYTTTFICPSDFMRRKMIQGGFDATKLQVLCNFMPTKQISPIIEKENYYCYVGRISIEKGVETLLNAAQKLPYTLKVAGGGPLLEALKLKYAATNIQFLGMLPPDQAVDLLSKAKFSVIPSEWYENNPLSVIESLSMQTPVLGANIGGIPELIEKDVTGDIFESGNVVDLQKKIEGMFSFSSKNVNFVQYNQQRFSAKNYYKRLIEIYN